MRYITDNRSDYGKIQLFHGAKTPSDLILTDEYDNLERSGIEVHVTCDRREDTWRGNYGLVTWLFNDTSIPELKKVIII